MASLPDKLNVAFSIETMLAIANVYNCLNNIGENKELPDSSSPESRKKRDQIFWLVTLKRFFNDLIEEDLRLLYLDQLRERLLDAHARLEYYEKEKAAEDSDQFILHEANILAILGQFQEQIASEMKRLDEAHRVLQELLQDRVLEYKDNYAKLLERNFMSPDVLNKDGLYELKVGSNTLPIEPNKINDIYQDSYNSYIGQLAQGKDPNLSKLKENRKLKYYERVRDEAGKIGLRVEDEDIEKSFEKNEAKAQVDNNFVKTQEHEIHHLKKAVTHVAALKEHANKIHMVPYIQ